MPTQKEIAQHLDMTQQAASVFCKTAGIDWRSLSIDQVRVAYIRHLREQAAGRASSEDGEYDLVAERARLAHHQANITALDERRKRGELIPANEVRAKWQDMIGAARARLLALPSRIAAACVGREEMEIERNAREIVHEALSELARGGD